jgi:hypothetical protein
VSLRDFLERLTGALDQAGVPYMIAGSVASTYYSAPRTTQEVDLVVELDGARLRSLLASLPEDELYYSPEAAHDALRRRSMFNVIDLATGWKADLIVRKGRPFSAEELRRRVRTGAVAHPRASRGRRAAGPSGGEALRATEGRDGPAAGAGDA